MQARKNQELMNTRQMNRFNVLLLSSVFALLFSSCGEGKIRPEPLSSISSSPDEYYGNVVEVPFKNQGGVRIVQVKINDCTEFPMIFDTGCSEVSISILELATLIKHGYISENDVIGITQAQIADGNVVEEAVVNLRKLQIGGYVCNNVVATISENGAAPLLLGNGALKNVGSFVVDDDAGVIKFYLK